VIDIDAFDASPLVPPDWLELGERPREAWSWRSDVTRVPPTDEGPYPFDRGFGLRHRRAPRGIQWLAVSRSEYVVYRAANRRYGIRVLEAFAGTWEQGKAEVRRQRLLDFAQRYGSIYSPLEQQLLHSPDGPMWGNSYWRWSIDASTFASAWNLWLSIRTLAAEEIGDVSRARRAAARRALRPDAMSATPAAVDWFRRHPLRGVAQGDLELVAPARGHLLAAINHELAGVETLLRIGGDDQGLRLVQEPRSLRGLLWLRFAGLVAQGGASLGYLDRLCRWCGGPILALRMTRRYCSDSHRRAAWVARQRARSAQVARGADIER
jgi:hypothetical protein